MLQIDGVSAGYGSVRVLQDVTLTAQAGQITCLMGRNGAGKSTLLKTVMGQVRTDAGTITLDGVALHDLAAHLIPRHGVAYVPQGRRLFGPLTVAENLSVGLMTRGFGDETRERVLTLFPRLRERLDQVAQTLSGGEQQMLAIGRALCLEPKVILLDEPSEGLQPSMVSLIRDVLLQLRESGVAVILVEQRPETVLRIADCVAFMAQGRLAEVADAHKLTPDAAQFRHYVGV